MLSTTLNKYNNQNFIKHRVIVKSNNLQRISYENFKLIHSLESTSKITKLDNNNC